MSGGQHYGYVGTTPTYFKRYITMAQVKRRLPSHYISKLYYPVPDELCQELYFYKFNDNGEFIRVSSGVVDPAYIAGSPRKVSSDHYSLCPTTLRDKWSQSSGTLSESTLIAETFLLKAAKEMWQGATIEEFYQMIYRLLMVRMSCVNADEEPITLHRQCPHGVILRYDGELVYYFDNSCVYRSCTLEEAINDDNITAVWSYIVDKAENNVWRSLDTLGPTAIRLSPQQAKPFKLYPLRWIPSNSCKANLDVVREMVVGENIYDFAYKVPRREDTLATSARALFTVMIQNYDKRYESFLFEMSGVEARFSGSLEGAREVRFTASIDQSSRSGAREYITANRKKVVASLLSRMEETWPADAYPLELYKERVILFSKDNKKVALVLRLKDDAVSAIRSWERENRAERDRLNDLVKSVGDLTGIKLE